jgi:alpha-tubulin suppressor-like RCC1 family protein
MLAAVSKRLILKLYSWGNPTLSIGYSNSQGFNGSGIKSLEIPEPISKCVMSESHSAILSESGSVYTFGSGKYGKLGHDNEKDIKEPLKLESLSKINVKIKDIALGYYHTILLTTEGNLWTMGYGGELKGGFIRKTITQGGGGLGHKDLSNKYVPTLVSSLKKQEKIVQIAAGTYHSLALGTTGNLYVWGKGEMGMLGNGKTDNLNIPTVNPYFEEFLKKGYRLKKIAACNSYSVGLLENGKVFTWGLNEHGQLGTGQVAHGDMYETFSEPTLVRFPDKVAIKDFKAGEKCCIFLSEDNRVFFTGIKIHRVPIEIKVPSDIKVVQVFALRDNAGYITGIFYLENNKVYSIFKIFSNKFSEEDIELKMIKTKSEAFIDLNVIEIGGGNSAHFCLLE